VRRFLTISYAWARRCVIAIVGGTVVVVGVLMIVLPGPAIVVIPAGFAILGLEFAWARRWLQRLRTSGHQWLGKTWIWLKPTKARKERRAQVLTRVSVETTTVHSVTANTKRDYFRLL